jgi:hypothetical protein
MIGLPAERRERTQAAAVYTAPAAGKATVAGESSMV